MPVSWPSTLPKTITDGYVFQPGDGREITEMEQGPRRIRKRFSNVPSAITLPFMMTLAQLKLFQDFWDDDINEGVDPFDIELMTDGQRAITTVQILARGQQTPMGGGLWRMALQVETL
jgi:hypothetical protein